MVLHLYQFQHKVIQLQLGVVAQEEQMMEYHQFHKKVLIQYFQLLHQLVEGVDKIIMHKI
jgi:hypothetical protein